MIYAWESYDILLQASETVLCRIPRHTAANLVGFCSPFYTILRSLKTEPTIRPKNGPLKLNCVSGAKFVVPYFGANFPPRMWADIAQTFEQGQRKIGSRNAAKLVARARSDKSSLKLFWRFRMLLLKYIAACHCVQLWWSTSQHIYATGTRAHSIYIYGYHGYHVHIWVDNHLCILYGLWTIKTCFFQIFRQEIPMFTFKIIFWPITNFGDQALRPYLDKIAALEDGCHGMFVSKKNGGTLRKKRMFMAM